MTCANPAHKRTLLPLDQQQVGQQLGLSDLSLLVAQRIGIIGVGVEQRIEPGLAPCRAPQRRQRRPVSPRSEPAIAWFAWAN
jgi:hypothetical protein